MPEYTAWQLSNLAGCASPDSINSPGAEFLYTVADGASDVLDNIAEGYDESDSVHQHADACVPVYTHHIWETFTDLGAWAEDPTDLGADASDMERAAQVALYMIAERLTCAVLDDWRDERAEDSRGRVREEGRDAGRAAASWVDLSEASDATLRSLVEDIDPATRDAFREPNLSGEFADDPTPRTIAEAAGLPEDDERVGWLCDLWEESAREEFWDAVERDAARILDDREAERDAVEAD